jgi:tRNA modification GTPase
VLWIQDATRGADETIDEELPDGIPVTVVRNKIDVSGDPAGIDDNEQARVSLSAKTGEGLDALRQRIRDLAGFRDLGEGAFTARRRHVEALKEAARHFAAGREALRDSRAGELLAEELRLAQLSLGTITGEVSSDDLLGEIFSKFCIGK